MPYITLKKSTLNTAICCALGFLTTSVLAQETTSEQTNEPKGSDLEIIEVTAQNRVQSVNDVPISMSVVSGEQLKNAGVTDIQTLNRIAPDFVTTNDSIATKVSLRGISTESSDEAQDQSLTVSIDGEYINRPRVMNAAMFDVQRVEVLRGPQGTLYGRNATGGAVNIIANKPQLGEFTGEGTVDVGNFNSRKINGAVNIPIGDNAATRIAVTSTQHDGYRQHANQNTESGDQDVQAARVGFQFEPTEEFTVYLAYETSSLDQQVPFLAAYDINASGQADDGTGNCNTSAGWSLVGVQDGNTLCAPSNTNNLSTIDKENFDAPRTAPFAFHKVDSDAYRANLTYNADDFTISYLAGYRDSTVDADEALNPGYIFYRNTDIKTLSHELRISGGEGKFFWQGGAFYFNETQDVHSALLAYIGAYPNGPQGYWVNTFYRPDVESVSSAIFGQVDVPLNDEFTLIVGGRWTHDRKTASQTNLPSGLTFEEQPVIRPIDTAGGVTEDLAFNYDEFTWAVGLNYEPDDDAMYYVKASKGYKAGGFDSTNNAYDPEILYAYEAGVKSQLDSGNLNGSVFYYDYSDLQVAVLLDTTKGGQTFNAGKVRIWGGEVSYNTWLTDSDRFTASANYLNAEYTEFAAAIPVQCLGGCGTTAVSSIDGELISLAGNSPSQAPEFIFTLGYDHYWEVDGASVVASVFSRWKSDYYMTAFNNNDGKQDSFSQTDLSLKYISESEDWEVMAYVRNIEDEQPLTFYSYTAAGPDDVQLWSFGAPRTMGVSATYRFY